jgi:hypothetical protein
MSSVVWDVSYVSPCPSDDYPPTIYGDYVNNLYEVGKKVILPSSNYASHLRYDRINNFFYFDYNAPLTNDININSSLYSIYFGTQGLTLTVLTQAYTASGPSSIGILAQTTLSNPNYIYRVNILNTQIISAEIYNSTDNVNYPGSIINGKLSIQFNEFATLPSSIDSDGNVYYPPILGVYDSLFYTCFNNRNDLELGATNDAFSLVEKTILNEPLPNHLYKINTNLDQFVGSNLRVLYEKDNINIFNSNGNVLIVSQGDQTFVDGCKPFSLFVVPYVGQILAIRKILSTYYLFIVDSISSSAGNTGHLYVVTTTDFITYTELTTSFSNVFNVIFSNSIMFDEETGYAYLYISDLNVIYVSSVDFTTWTPIATNYANIIGVINSVFFIVDTIAGTIIDNGNIVRTMISTSRNLIDDKTPIFTSDNHFTKITQDKSYFKKCGNVYVYTIAVDYFDPSLITSFTSIQLGLNLQSKDLGVTWSQQVFNTLTPTNETFSQIVRYSFQDDGIYLGVMQGASSTGLIVGDYYTCNVACTFNVYKAAYNSVSGYCDIISLVNSPFTVTTGFSDILSQYILNDITAYVANGFSVFNFTDSEFMYIPTNLGFPSLSHYQFCMGNPVGAAITGVTVAPSSYTINSGTTHQFTATVTGTGPFSHVVSWSCIYGTINSSGLYTAPLTGTTDTITATSYQDNTKSGTSSITINVEASVALSPSGPQTINTSQELALTAIVTGISNTNVTWTVDGIPNGNSTVGTITELNGNSDTVTYLAPVNAGARVISAISVADTSKYATVTINVTSVATGPLITNVHYLNLAETSIDIAWDLSEVGTGQVMYSTDLTYNLLSTPELSFNYSSHEQHLSGLTPNTLYHYKVKSADQLGNISISGDNTFQTASSVSSITSVSINPSSTTVYFNESQQFIDTVTGNGSFNTTVTWTCLHGTITSNGLYTAPASGVADSVTATSVQDNTKLANAVITLTTAPTGTSVKDSPYNATGNGITDDSAAIQACCDAVAAIGGTVIFPPGIYMINSNFSSSHSGLRPAQNLSGGRSMTLDLTSGATLKVFVNNFDAYTIFTFASSSNVTINGGNFVGDSPYPTHHSSSSDGQDGTCIYLYGTNNITLNNVNCSYAWGDGILVDNNATNTTINDCNCQHNWRSGMSVVSANGMTVTGGIYSNNGGLAGAGGGIDLEPNVTQTVSNIAITGVTASNNLGCGISTGGRDLHNTSNVTLTNCTTNGNGLQGIYCNDSTINSSITGCTSNSNASNGIELGEYTSSYYGTENFTVIGNHCSSNHGYGIEVSHALNATVTGNDGSSNTLGSGVYNGGSNSGCTLSPNAIV